LAFYVYILRCSDDSYYTGHTDNIEKRISEHNNGSYHGYTSTKLPVTVVFIQEFGTRVEALEAEKKIKTWGKRKKDILVNFGWSGFTSLKIKK